MTQNPDFDRSPGGRFRAAASGEGGENPLLLPGAINAHCAQIAVRQGFRALYLSGGGVAAAMGMPDLAVTTLHDVVGDAARITAVVDVPLLVDADTGFGSWLSINRTVKELCRVNVAGMHLEDQTAVKRCGHRPNKILAPAAEMCDRIRAAVDARPDGDFVVMARTDAIAGEGLQKAVERAVLYAEAGADMIFAEAAGSVADYRAFKDACGLPVLANITEFGKTPMFSADDLRGAADIMLFPLSAFRAMNRAAENVYASIRNNGTQKNVVDGMQTRDELYDILGYRACEDKLDELFGKEK